MPTVEGRVIPQAQSGSPILDARFMKKPQASGRGFSVVWTGSGISCNIRPRCLVVHGFTPGPHELVEAGRNLALPVQARRPTERRNPCPLATWWLLQHVCPWSAPRPAWHRR